MGYTLPWLSLENSTCHTSFLMKAEKLSLKTNESGWKIKMQCQEVNNNSYFSSSFFTFFFLFYISSTLMALSSYRGQCSFCWDQYFYHLHLFYSFLHLHCLEITDVVAKFFLLNLLQCFHHSSHNLIHVLLRKLCFKDRNPSLKKLCSTNISEQFWSRNVWPDMSPAIFYVVLQLNKDIAIT